MHFSKRQQYTKNHGPNSLRFFVRKCTLPHHGVTVAGSIKLLLRAFFLGQLGTRRSHKRVLSIRYKRRVARPAEFRLRVTVCGSSGFAWIALTWRGSASREAVWHEPWRCDSQKDTSQAWAPALERPYSYSAELLVDRRSNWFRSLVSRLCTFFFSLCLEL